MAGETKAKKKKKRKTGMNVKAKKKTAVARAVIRKGTGRITINKKNIKCFGSSRVRKLIEEPVVLAGPIANEADIELNIEGGGFMGRAVAARAAIAKALLQFSRDNKLRERFLNYDRLLLVDDPRRKESKKPLGTGARKRKQKSKR